MITGLSGPQGIAFNQMDEMIVAEYLGHSYKILDHQERILQ